MKESEDSKETNKILQILDWAYEKALNGLPGMGTAIDLAHSYEGAEGTLDDKVNSLIRWQITKTATTGFLTGLGGIITLPVAIPADLASSYYVEIRMIAAIAHMGGYDINDDKVKTLVYLCLVGESIKDILKDVGIDVSLRIGHQLLKKLPGRVLFRINNKVGIKLATKSGAKGVINLVKVIPVLGGIVGGSLNSIATNIIGNVARNTFIKTSFNESSADQFLVLLNEDKNVPNIELIKFFSYLNLIKIDGIRKKEELQLFNDLINNSLLDEINKFALLEKLRSTELEEIDYSLLINNPEQSLELLKNLILIALCDNDLHNEEEMNIKNVGKQLGLNEHEIENLITETKKIQS